MERGIKTLPQPNHPLPIPSLPPTPPSWVTWEEDFKEQYCTLAIGVWPPRLFPSRISDTALPWENFNKLCVCVCVCVRERACV